MDILREILAKHVSEKNAETIVDEFRSALSAHKQARRVILAREFAGMANDSEGRNETDE